MSIRKKYNCATTIHLRMAYCDKELSGK